MVTTPERESKATLTPRKPNKARLISYIMESAAEPFNLKAGRCFLTSKYRRALRRRQSCEYVFGIMKRIYSRGPHDNPVIPHNAVACSTLAFRLMMRSEEAEKICLYWINHSRMQVEIEKSAGLEVKLFVQKYTAIKREARVLTFLKDAGFDLVETK
jgi:hypothetical protein